MKKWIAFILLFAVNLGYSTGIFFPEFNVYSEIQANGKFVSSYRIDMMIDTGLKYGVKLGVGIKSYNVSSMDSNFMILNSIRIYMQPFNLFTLGYFIGKNTTLGYSDIGYQGFQFHQKQNLEYIGYKDITGTGIEIYRSFWDDLLEPHLYFYSSPNTNVMNINAVIKLKFVNTTIEGFFGVNLNWYKTFGIFVTTVYNKLDFQAAIYSPSTPFLDVPNLDDLYVSITEHLFAGYFEQTFGLFMRPFTYNGYTENTRGDLDVYLAIGGRIEELGFGVEGSLTVSSNYKAMGVKPGLYVYFVMNNLRYKLGGYYAIGTLGTINPYPSAFGGFAEITGKF